MELNEERIVRLLADRVSPTGIILAAWFESRVSDDGWSYVSNQEILTFLGRDEGGTTRLLKIMVKQNLIIRERFRHDPNFKVNTRTKVIWGE